MDKERNRNYNLAKSRTVSLTYCPSCPNLVLHLKRLQQQLTFEQKHKSKPTREKKSDLPFSASENFPFLLILKHLSNYHVSVAFCVEQRFLPSSLPHLHFLSSLLLLVSSFPQLLPPVNNPIFYYFFSSSSTCPPYITKSQNKTKMTIKFVPSSHRR